MTWYTFPGQGLFHNADFFKIAYNPAFTPALMDATGEKITQSGQVIWEDEGTHDIESVSFKTGTIVATSNSVLEMSLQNVSLTSGPPQQPDEVQDQVSTFNINTLTSDTWTTKTLSSNRTVAHGELMAVVWDFNAGGRLGSDVLRISSLGVSSNPGYNLVTQKAASYSAISSVSNIIFTASDGTLGSLAYGFNCNSVTTIPFNVDTLVNDEIATGVKYGCGVKLSGVQVFINIAAGANFDIILYNGTTALSTVSVDANNYRGTGNPYLVIALFSSLQELAADTLYRIAVKPTTTNNVTLNAYDVTQAGELDFMLGEDFHYWSRLDGGAWDNENTLRCLHIFPIIAQMNL